MSERLLFSLFQKDKTITNPLNRTEVFNCSDIYSDYKSCNALASKGKIKKVYCQELRLLGQQCFTQSEEDFTKYLIRKFDEKREYIEYLKKEDSLLYFVYINNPNTFKVLIANTNETQFENAALTNKDIIK